MGQSETRPRPSDKPPILNQSLEILEKILKIEMERLDTAIRIEKERRIVFPETSVIIHDILKLHTAITNNKRTNGKDILDILGEEVQIEEL